MSKALFDYFADESVGVIHGSWEFGSGGRETSTSSKHTQATPKTTKTHTATRVELFSRKSSSLSSHTSSSSSAPTSTLPTPTTTPINYMSGDASGLAIPTGVLTPGAANNLNAINQAIINMGAMIVAGGNAN